jgi:hypothetical protein
MATTVHVPSPRKEREGGRERERGREREGERVLYGLVKCDESGWQKTIWSNWTNRRKNYLIEIATKPAQIV